MHDNLENVISSVEEGVIFYEAGLKGESDYDFDTNNLRDYAKEAAPPLGSIWMSIPDENKPDLIYVAAFTEKDGVRDEKALEEALLSASEEVDGFQIFVDGSRDWGDLAEKYSLNLCGRKEKQQEKVPEAESEVTDEAKAGEHVILKDVSEMRVRQSLKNEDKYTIGFIAGLKNSKPIWKNIILDSDHVKKNDDGHTYDIDLGEAGRWLKINQRKGRDFTSSTVTQSELVRFDEMTKNFYDKKSKTADEKEPDKAKSEKKESPYKKYANGKVVYAPDGKVFLNEVPTSLVKISEDQKSVALTVGGVEYKLAADENFIRTSRDKPKCNIRLDAEGSYSSVDGTKTMLGKDLATARIAELNGGGRPLPAVEEPAPAYQYDDEVIY